MTKLAAIVLLAMLATGSIGVGYAHTPPPLPPGDFDFEVTIFPSMRIAIPGETVPFKICVSFIGQPQNVDISLQPPPTHLPRYGLDLPEFIRKYVPKFEITYFGVLGTNFRSTLTLTLSQETPPGVYELTVYATDKPLERKTKSATASLIVQGGYYASNVPLHPKGNYFWCSRYFGSVSFFKNYIFEVSEEKPVGTFFLGITVGAWIPEITEEGRYTVYYYVTRNGTSSYHQNATDRSLTLHIYHTEVFGTTGAWVDKNGTLNLIVDFYEVFYETEQIEQIFENYRAWSPFANFSPRIHYERIADIPIYSWGEWKFDVHAYYRSEVVYVFIDYYASEKKIIKWLDLEEAYHPPAFSYLTLRENYERYWFLDWFLIPLLIVVSAIGITVFLEEELPRIQSRFRVEKQRLKAEDEEKEELE